MEQFSKYSSIQHTAVLRVTRPASKLLQLGLLLPWGHRSCQDPAAVWTSTSSGHPPGLAWSPSSAGDGHLLHHRQQQQIDSFPHRSLHMGYWEISQHLEHCLPCFFTDHGVCGAVSFMFSQPCLQLLLCTIFFTHLKYVIPEALQLS